MDIFKLFGRIAIDSSEASDELSRFIKQANNAGKKVGKALTDITKGAKSMATTLNRVGEQAEQSMRKIAGGFAIATTAASAAAVTIGKKALDIRSSIEQGMGGADAVFQQYATHIKESAQDAWKTAGLSMEEYLATANKMGSLFQGAGFTVMESMELTANAMQRAADVASIMGIDMSAAMESIAGMAKGNFTMMDNLGVAINDTTLQVYALEKGISKSVSTMTTAEKVGLAYEMFMERTAKYAGNYAKENETAAGSLQTLTAAWENFLGGVGSFEDLENSAFGYLRIAAKTMSLDDFLPLIDGAQKTVHEVSEILTTAELNWSQKLANARKYLLEESVGFVSALGDHFVKSADTIYSIISETLADINVYLPNYVEVGRNIFNAVRDGVKKAANELINSAAIISPDVVSGWFDLKTDFITIGLNFLGRISDAISEDLNSPDSLVGASLRNGMDNVLKGLAKNLPKMTDLATALISEIANAISEKDENGNSVLAEKIGNVVSGIVTSLKDWIDDGGVGKFTSAATSFLFGLGEELVRLAPEVLSGFVKGIWDGLTGILDGVASFFSDEDAEELQNLRDSLNGIEESFNATKAAIETATTAYNLSMDDIEARLQLAQGHLDTIANLEEKAELSPEDLAAWQNAVTSLVNLYPELGKYVDAETGKFDISTTAIRNHITELQNLARQKALNALIEEYETQYTQYTKDRVDAQIALNRANNEKEDRQKAIELLLEKSRAGETYFNATETAFLKKYSGYYDNKFLEKPDGSSRLGLNDNQQIRNYQYAMIEGLDKEIVELNNAVATAEASLNELNTTIKEEVDVFNTLYQDTESIATSAESIAEKIKRIDHSIQPVLFDEGGVFSTSSANQAKRGSKHLMPIEFGQKLEEASESASEEVEVLGTQTQTAAANVEQFSGTVSVVDKAVLALGLAAEAASEKLHSIDTTTIYYMRDYGGGVNDSIQFGAEAPGFASGLAFVPRDNLLARLHQGEAVLTAQEAYEWRQQKKMGSIEAAVAQLANAVADLQEGFQANMNLYINKRHVASALSRDMGRSIGNREYTLLRGMGG